MYSQLCDLNPFVAMICFLLEYRGLAKNKLHRLHVVKISKLYVLACSGAFKKQMADHTVPIYEPARRCSITHSHGRCT
jgi:hypothetical protein